MRRKLIYLGAMVGLVAVGCALLSKSACDACVGQPAPPAEGTDADGQFFRLSDYSGQVVMVSFWGSFCGPCRALFPHEKKLVEKYRGQPFVLLGVNVDADMRAFQQCQAERGLTWRSWADGAMGPIASGWAVSVVPTVVVIDHKGIVRFRSEGAPDSHHLDSLIEQLVHDIPPRPNEVQ